MNSKTSSEPITSQWSILTWIIGSVCIPITLPWMIVKMIGSLNKKRQRSELPGKVVLITGASSGLGESLAHSFYSLGCRVVLAARRKEVLERVKKDLMQTHPTGVTYPPIVIPMDLTELNSLPGKVEEIIKIFGHIDILINNGGVSHRGDVLTTNVDVDIKIMLVNYFGSVALTKAVLPLMVKRKQGHIVCVSSVQGRIAIPYRSAYAASKHALQAFCDTMRAEVADHNIDVTVISPGYINTSLSLNAITGNGQSYGVMDPGTAAGYPPSKVADDVVNAVVTGKKDIVIAPLGPRIAIILRAVCPTIYFWIMGRRAQKLSN